MQFQKDNIEHVLLALPKLFVETTKEISFVDEKIQQLLQPEHTKNVFHIAIDMLVSSTKQLLKAIAAGVDYSL